MTQEEFFEDIKQLITTTVAQATAHLATKQDLENLAIKLEDMTTKEDLANGLNSLRTELKADIGDLSLKIDTIADALTEDSQEYEQRLTKLEHRTA